MLRERLGLTLTAMAKEIGISPQYLFAIETGETPLSPRVHAIAQVKFGKMRGEA